MNIACLCFDFSAAAAACAGTVATNDSWGEQNLMQPPDMVNPNQPIAWLTRLFTFLPDMAHALDEPIPEWWEEILVHLPPQPITAPDANGGGQ